MDANPNTEVRASARVEVTDSDRMLCRQCGYVLNGLPEPRCPECGAKFDPADAKTFYQRRLPNRIERFLLSPPGWPINGAAWVAGVGMLAAHAYPGAIFLLVLGSFLIWVIIAAFWCVRVAGFLVVSWMRRHARSELLSRRWLASPCIALAVIGMIVVRVPQRIALRISEPWLMDVVREFREKGIGSASMEDRWAGVYRIEFVEYTERGVEMRLAWTGFLFDEDRLVYSENPSKILLDPTWTKRRMRGNWYHFHCDD